MSTRFCPNCGSPVGPEQNFCPACGAKVDAAPAPQQPVYQYPAPQQPVYQQPAQPAYQAPRPAYNPYGQAAPKTAGVNNIWAVIVGGSVALLSFVALLLGILNGRFIRSGGLFMGFLWFFCSVGIAFLFLAQRRFSDKTIPSQKRIFSYVFLGTFVLAFTWFITAFSIRGGNEVFFILIMLLLIASGVFAVLSFLDEIKKPNLLGIGLYVVLFIDFFWFLNTIIFLAGAGWGYTKFTFIFTPLLLAAAAVLPALHYMKAPNQKMF